MLVLVWYVSAHLLSPFIASGRCGTSSISSHKTVFSCCSFRSDLLHCLVSPFPLGSSRFSHSTWRYSRLIVNTCSSAAIWESIALRRRRCRDWGKKLKHVFLIWFASVGCRWMEDRFREQEIKMMKTQCESRRMDKAEEMFSISLFSFCSVSSCSTFYLQSLCCSVYKFNSFHLSPSLSAPDDSHDI